MFEWWYLKLIYIYVVCVYIKHWGVCDAWAQCNIKHVTYIYLWFLILFQKWFNWWYLNKNVCQPMWTLWDHLKKIDLNVFVVLILNSQQWLLMWIFSQVFEKKKSYHFLRILKSHVRWLKYFISNIFPNSPSCFHGNLNVLSKSWSRR